MKILKIWLIYGIFNLGFENHDEFQTTYQTAQGLIYVLDNDRFDVSGLIGDAIRLYRKYDLDKPVIFISCEMAKNQKDFLFPKIAILRKYSDQILKYHVQSNEGDKKQLYETLKEVWGLTEKYDKD